MLSDYSADEPSEVATVASIPVDVAKAIVSVPAEILQLRVNYDNQAAALINARASELQAQLALVEAQRALEAARARGAPGRVEERAPSRLRVALRPDLAAC